MVDRLTVLLERVTTVPRGGWICKRDPAARRAGRKHRR